MRHTLCTLLLGACLLAAACSASRKTRTASSTPPGNNTAWIGMMDDPKANYFAAVKVFEEYWKDKQRPTTEHDLFSAEDKEDALRNSSYSTSRNPDEPAVKYRFEYKKFLHWKEEVAPYVQPDGRILSAEERIHIWQQQKAQRQ